MTSKANPSVAALALVAALGLGASSAAHAGHDGADVYWSIGMSQPGISVGVSNMPAAPVVVYERYYEPAPRVVYVPAPVYYPQPVYRVIAPGYYSRGHAYGHWKDRDDRHGRWDERGRGGRRDRERDHDRDERHAERGERAGRGGPESYMGNRR